MGGLTHLLTDPVRRRAILRNPIATVISSVAIWSIALQIVAIAGFKFIDPQGHPGVSVTSAAWVRWDGGWFAGIVAHGYSAHLSPAFYPGFPLLARGVYEVLHPVGLVGTSGAMLLTNQLLVFAMGVFVYLLATALTDSTEIGVRTVQCLLVFPFAYFLLAPYSETAFLTCVAGFGWALKTRRYWLAAAFGAFASATRSEGVALALVMAIGYLEQHEWRWRSLSIRAVGWIVAPLTGAIAYAIYQWAKFGSPTASEHFEKIGWARAFTLNLWHVFKAQFGPQYLTAGKVLGEPAEVFIVFPLLIAFAFLTWRVWQRFGATMGSLCVLFIVIPLISGSTVSFNRYMLPMLPAFVLIADWTLRRAWFDFAYRTIGCLLLALFLVMFVHSVWTG